MMIDPTIGEVRLFAGTFAPAGWVYCQGQVLPTHEYFRVFFAIGDKYGGDGFNTFALPSLADLVPGVKYVICLDGNFPSRP